MGRRVNLLLLVVVAAALIVLVGRSRRRRRQRRQEAIDRCLGFTVDLVAVVMGSGGTIRQAVGVVADQGPEPVRPCFRSVLDRSAAGRLLVDALAEATIDLGPAFHPLLGALTNAEVDGAPIGTLLTRLADDIESRDRWRDDASAGRLPVALVPPLVVCLLPAVVVGAVVPLAIVAIGQLR